MVNQVTFCWFVMQSDIHDKEAVYKKALKGKKKKKGGVLIYKPKEKFELYVVLAFQLLTGERKSLYNPLKVRVGQENTYVHWKKSLLYASLLEMKQFSTWYHAEKLTKFSVSCLAKLSSWKKSATVKTSSSIAQMLLNENGQWPTSLQCPTVFRLPGYSYEYAEYLFLQTSFC